MGQRLNIEIWNSGQVLANAYYHFTCRLMNKKCVDSRAADTITPIDFSTSDITMYKD